MAIENNGMNIVLANAAIKNGNMGCVALSITMMSMIDDIMKTAGIGYNLYLPDSQFGDGQKHTYRFGENDVISYCDVSYPAGISFIDTLKGLVKDIAKRKWRTRNTIPNADFILDLGHGDSFSDIYGEHRFMVVDRIHKLARKYGKPYCILPQTIGPFVGAAITDDAHKSIAEADICMARDRQSLDYVLRNVPGQTNCKEYIDVAFFLPYEKISQEDGFTHVGLNLSALLWHGGYTQNNQFGLKCSYPNVVYGIIDYFLARQKTKVHLVPHVVGTDRDVENDYAVSYDIWRKYGNPNLLLAPLALGPMEIKSYIAGMDFFIGARMHAAIGAFSSGVPVMPMAYSRKFNGLFQDTLAYPYMCDMKAMTDEEILHMTEEAFLKRDILKGLVEERMNGIVATRKKELIADLKKFFRIKE